MMLWTRQKIATSSASGSGHNLNVSIFLRLSPPAHLITFATVLYLTFILFPVEKSIITTATTKSEPSTLIGLLYIGSFATHFGTQIWMSLISGVFLFFNLPRHIFGMVQKVLFPKYFFVNSILGFVTLVSYARCQAKEESFQFKIQMWALAICFVTELAVRLYLVPAMLKTMEARGTFEKRAGVGNEIGRHEPGVLRLNSNYMELHKKFRRLHGICALANLVAVGSNTFHLYYLAVKLGALLT